MTTETNKLERLTAHTIVSSDSFDRLERAAAWHFPSFLWQVLPTTFKDDLRKLRARMISSYVTRRLPRDTEFRQSSEDAQASASLSIVVPIHDSPEVTRRCLLSLQKYAPKAEIILVDDASQLEETGKLLKNFSDRNGWLLIRNSEALRHSAACGTGASLATRPYLCLLNSDTVATPWSWRLIVRAFESSPQIGVAGPSTSYAGTIQQHDLVYCARYSMNDSQICEYARRLLADDSNPVITDLPAINGFAFFMRRSLWESLGGFDRNIPDYRNETELCMRVIAAGHRAVWVRNSYIHHLGGASYKSTLGAEDIEAHTKDANDYIARKYGSCHM